MKLHPELTCDVVMDGVKRTMFGTDNVGFCTSCGAENSCEPDAEHLECECCGQPTVFGAEILLLEF